jgi:protein SCO1/2
MDRGVRNTLFWITAFIAAILGLFVATTIMPKGLSEEEALKLGFYHFDQPRVVSDFKMTNQLGENVSLDTLRGNWSLLFFGFTTCPDICPTTLSVLSDSVKEMKAPATVVMISVDPERDTAERLNQYVPAFHPDFMGFRGSFDETVKFAEQLNAAFGKVPGRKPGTYTMDHTASLVLMDPEGRYAGFIKAPHNAQNIARVVGSL